jgi:predicted nucleic acid-binding Zn ribbon protein
VPRSRYPKRDRSDEVVPIADILGGLLGERALAGGLVVGRLAAEWPSVVGERLASETAPARLEGRALTVAVSSGPWGAQAGFLAEEIRRKANEALGSEEVDRVVIVVRDHPRKPL